MAVREIDIKKLKAAEYNPRIELRPGMPEYEKLKASILEYGNVEPIVWNERTGNVVGGHQRLEVLKDLGTFKKVPCSVVDLSPEDEKVLNVALNKIRGKWDYDKLEAILAELDGELAESSGFNEGELAVLLADNSDIDEFAGFDFDADDEEDWWDDEDAPELGLSYAISLLFDSRDSVQEWLDKEGVEAVMKPKSSTLVIRME